MKKLLASLSTLILMGSVAAGATGAFFSDTETSSGNTFSAGAIDLKIDNDSYYNGNHCVNVPLKGSSSVYEWQGSALFPVPGTPCTTSWSLADLTVQKFFDFTDVKPGDNGEDTISLHVDTNSAYLCANVKLTSNDENGCTAPEKLVDGTCDNPGPGQGELASNINFIMWADNGNNVLENNEPVLYEGPIGALGTGGEITIPLADSGTNIWTGIGGPAPAGVTQFIGKAWCFGTITQTPVAPGTGNPVSNPGYTCNGTLLDNSTQGDSLTADITFNATQARNNPGFVCIGQNRPQAKLTVIKVVHNLPGSGNKTVSDFHLSVFDGSVSTGVTSGVQVTIPVGSYQVDESGAPGYVASFSGDCDIEGNVTLAANDVKTCTITNTELPANITLIKNVTGSNPLDAASVFKLRIDGTLVPQNTSFPVTANHAHAITEDTISSTQNAPHGYSFVSITGSPQCPAVLGGTATLSEGQAITCTITNNKNP